MPTPRHYPSRAQCTLGTLCVCLVTSACGTALSSFTPAHVARPKHVQVELGTDVSWPVGTLQNIIDIANDLANQAQNEELSSAEQQQLLNAAWGALINPPAVIMHLGLGVGVAEDWEVSGRLVSGGWRLAGRHQLLHAATEGVDLSVGLGLGRDQVKFGSISSVDVLDLGGYRRWNLDIPFLVGQSGPWYRWWAGPKLLASSYHAGLSVNLPPTDNNSEGTSYAVTIDGTTVHLGAQAGVALGYKNLFFAAELTAAYLGATAELRTTNTNLANFDLTTSGGVFYPAVGLMGEF